MKLIRRQSPARYAIFVALLLLAGGLFPASAEQSAFPAPSFTQSQLAAIAREASEAVEQAMESTGASAASIALGDGGGTVWSAQFGFADKDAKNTPAPDTMFGIGSTSKMFATVAAMILVDRGMVELDVPLVRYLPEFRMASPGYEKITIRMLLNHAAGFPGSDYRNAITRAPIPGYADQVQSTLAVSRLKYEPGWMNVYANDGFTMVELLVKKMTGSDFTEFVAREILSPLGMNHSTYPLASLGEGSYAKPYSGELLLPQEYVGPLASGGLYSTPSDLTRFAAMLIGKGSLQGKRILSPESVAEMGVDQTAGSFNPLSSGFFRNGLGWDTVDQQGLAFLIIKAWEKGGDTNSYGSTLIVLPEEGISVAVTGASGLHSSNATAIAERVLARALVEKGKLAAMPVPAPAAARQTATVPPEFLKNMSGVYASFNAVNKVELDSDGSLSLYSYRNDAWVQAIRGMSYRDDGWFSSSDAEAPPIDVTRIVADGRDYLAIRMPSPNGWYRTTTLFEQKLAPQAPLSPAWQKRMGTTWLPVNYTAEDDYLAPGMEPRIRLKAIEGADGYVFSHGPDGWMATRPASEKGDYESRSFILIPQLNGRDLYDVSVILRNGEEWIRQSSTLYRPLDSVPGLSPGDNLVVTGPEGYAEWRRLPAETQFAVAGAKSFKYYDANFVLQDTDAQKTGADGGYLAVFGVPGGRARISVLLTSEQKARIAEVGRKAAESVLKSTGGSALTAAIVDNDGLVWAGQFGSADRTTGSLPQATTMFGIGSVSKMFATVSAMILVDRKLVNLDEPLSTYLPEFRMADPRYRDITVRMVLNHVAGLPGADLRNAVTPVLFTEMADQALQTLKMQRLKHEPGFMSVYANDGFTLAELLIEAVSGMRFPDFVQKEIFSPLEMTHSRYPNVEFPADSYARVHFGEEVAPWYFFNMYGTGALFSTPTDMTHFAMMLASGGEYKGKRILSEAAVRAMGHDETAGTFNPLPSDYMRFGLGWDTVVQPGMKALGIRAWQKGGDITGFYGATMIVLPDEGMAAIVAGASGVGSSASSEVAESLLLQALVEKGRLAELPAPIVGTASAQRQTDIAERIAIEGYYASSGKLYRVKFNADSTLSVEQLSSGAWEPFGSGHTARADGWYSSDDPAAFSLRFIDTEQGRYMGLRKKSGYGHYTIHLLFAQKLENAPPYPEAWKTRINDTWLLANETPSLAVPDDSADPRIKITSHPELPGYINYEWEGGVFAVRPVSGEDSSASENTLAAMFLLIPGAMGRDLNDLVSETIGGTEYLRVGGSRFRAASTAPTLGAVVKGQEKKLSLNILIGEKGLGEWTRIVQPSERVRAISITSASLWRLYDESFNLVASGSRSESGKDTAELPDSADGFWLVTYGSPGSTVKLNLLPYAREQSSIPPVDESKRAELQATLEAEIAKYKIPGAIAGLWFPGKGEWVGTAGIGNPATGKAPGIDDKVRIGSITKSFTATVVLQLVDEGLLTLNDPLSRWEPQVPGARDITVRHLLNMTSGLFNYTDLPEFWNRLDADPQSSWTPRQLVDMAIAEPPLFQPGAQYMYCNTNYILLGMIIEKVTGRTVSEEFSEKIINRLGLENTSMPMTPEIGEPYMRGYKPAQGEEDGSDTIENISICSPTPYWTAGGVTGTLGDLRIWLKAIASGELLSPEMHAEQLSFKAPNSEYYGLGVMNGGKLFGHSGEVPGYNSSMYYIPSMDAVCIVLAGRYPSEIEGASEEIMSSLIQTMLASSLSGFSYPEPADFSSLPWREAFLAAHGKLSSEYAFGEWKSVDWAGLESRFLPRIEKAQAEANEKALYLALHEYLFSIPDGHLSLKAENPEVSRTVASELVGGGFGLSVAELDDGRIIATGLIPGGAAAAAGIARGAEILSWNGMPTKTALDRINVGALPYKALTTAIGGANPPATDYGRRLEQCRLLARGPEGAKAEVEFKNPDSMAKRYATLAAVDDNGASLTMADFASRPELSDKIDYRILPEGFGYILVRMEFDLANPGYPTRVYESFKEAVSSFVDAKVPGIILDFRGNYGGSDQLAADMCGFFYTSPSFYEMQEYFDRRDGRFLRITISERGPDPIVENIMIEPQSPYYSGAVAVLVNPQTKSSGEGIPMGIARLPHGKVIGFNGTNGSFGMVGGEIQLPGGFSIGYPFGRSVDSTGLIQLDSRMGSGGVTPGLTVPKTYENVMSFASGVDVELGYAIKYLSEQQKAPR